MCAAGTFNSHALLIGKFSAAFSTKTPQALPADSDPCPHPCFVSFALFKDSGISPSHFQCGFGPPRWEAGGWGRAGTRRGEERTRCPRSPGRAGVSPSPLDAVRVWGKAQAALRGAGFSFLGCRKLRSHFTTCHPLSPRGSRSSRDRRLSRRLLARRRCG